MCAPCVCVFCSVSGLGLLHLNVAAGRKDLRFSERHGNDCGVMTPPRTHPLPQQQRAFQRSRGQRKRFRVLSCRLSPYCFTQDFSTLSRQPLPSTNSCFVNCSCDGSTTTLPHPAKSFPRCIFTRSRLQMA